MSKITEKVAALLGKREFVSVGTCGKDGQPNSAPKFFFRAKGHFIYLIDYVIGKTVANLKENPRISVSFMDQESLEAYRLNGVAELIEKGRVFKKILDEWNKKLVNLATNRVLEAVKTGKKHKHYEVEMSEKFMVLKIKTDSVVKIGRRGDIWKESD